MSRNRKATYHLPGLFEFYDLYKPFLKLYREHHEYFYDWCQIGSIYGAPADCLWGGGRAGYGENTASEVFDLMEEYSISPRLTFSNSLLREEHLSDKKCNDLCRLFSASKNSQGGVIVASDLLAEYIRDEFPNLYLVSSTTKVLTDFCDLEAELDREEFSYVVLDFRLNKSFDRLEHLTVKQKDKVEFLCNECCYIGCKDRYACYQAVSRDNLGLEEAAHSCNSPDKERGYSFAKAMASPAFIGILDIRNSYLPMGFTQFKIEGRSLGSAMVLEFLLYYMVKPEYQIHVREAIYLDNSLDLF